MIHTIEIDGSAELEPLRKEFRKKLMTGGGVIRIRAGLVASELQLLCDRFIASSEDRAQGVRALVGQELLRQENLPEAAKQVIIAHGIIPDTRARDTSLERSISVLDDQSLRCFFLGALGEGDEGVSHRRALAKCSHLPADLMFFLGRDPDRSVRFQLKFIGIERQLVSNES